MLACAHWSTEAYPQCWDFAAHTVMHLLQEHSPWVAVAEDELVEDSRWSCATRRLVPCGRPRVLMVVLLLLRPRQLHDADVVVPLQLFELGLPPFCVVSILYESL